MIRHSALLAALLLSMPLAAQNTFTLHNGTTLTVRTISTELHRPSGLAIDPQGVLWAVEVEAATVNRIDPATGLRQVVLQAPFSMTTTAGGSVITAIYDLVVDPGFSTGRPYIYLAHATSDGTQHVTKFTYSDGQLRDPVVLVSTEAVAALQPCSLLQLSDGTLLFGTGSFDTQAPQELNSTTGKVLRLNTDGSAPQDNPWYDPLAPTSARSYLYTRGHRTVQGMVQVPRIDPTLQGMVYATEWGSNANDEINILHSGKNYGWPDHEGFCTTPTSTNECPRTTADVLFTGVAYYAHPAIPEWQRKLLVGSYRAERFLVMDLDAQGSILNKDASRAARNVTVLADSNVLAFATGGVPERPRDVLAANDGRIYVALHQVVDEGGVDRIAVLENPAMHVLVTSAQENANDVLVRVAPNPVVDHVNIQLGTAPADEWSVLCTDQLGRIVLTTKVSAGSTMVTLPCADLPHGMYGVSVHLGSTVVRSTFIR